MNPYLAIIFPFAGNFNPRGFQLCNGQILAISSNTALFSLLGVNYGGNGQSNFGLPDLRGRAAVSQGQGPGLSDYVVGEQLGTESVTLLSSNIPAHTHSVNSYTGSGNASSPAAAMFAEGPKKGLAGKAPDFYVTGTATATALNPTAVGFNVGGANTPFSILQPTLTMSAIICTSGVFPARN